MDRVDTGPLVLACCFMSGTKMPSNTNEPCNKMTSVHFKRFFFFFLIKGITEIENVPVNFFFCLFKLSLTFSAHVIGNYFTVNLYRKVKPSGNYDIFPKLYKLTTSLGVASNYFPIALKRVSNWLYWGDDRVWTTWAAGKRQRSLGGLSMHARLIL